MHLKISDLIPTWVHMWTKEKKITYPVLDKGHWW